MAWLPSLMAQVGSEGRGECTIHLEYFLPEGEKGRPQPYLPTPQPARRQRSRRHRRYRQHGPSTPRLRSFNFEGTLLPFFPISAFFSVVHFPASAPLFASPEPGQTDRRRRRRCFLSNHATHLPLWQNSLSISLPWPFSLLPRLPFVISSSIPATRTSSSSS